MVEHTEISTAEFLSVCCYLAQECGKIIRDVAESDDFKLKEKVDASPVTIADLRVQRTIEDNLRAIFPTLNI
jgi:3'(2'), 5'-bisphosphate nucleotidase